MFGYQEKKRKEKKRKIPLEKEKREEDESGECIRVENKDKVIHAFGHGGFAECGQPNIKSLCHYHGHKWHQTFQP